MAGDKTSLEKTVGYIEKRGIGKDPTPLKSFLTFLWNMKIIYGEDKAMKLASEIADP